MPESISHSQNPKTLPPKLWYLTVCPGSLHEHQLLHRKRWENRRRSNWWEPWILTSTPSMKPYRFTIGHPLYVCMYYVCICVWFWVCNDVGFFLVCGWNIRVGVESKPSIFSWQSELGGGHKDGWRSLETSYHGYSSFFYIPIFFSTTFCYLLRQCLSFLYSHVILGKWVFFNFEVYVGHPSSIVISIDFRVVGFP